MESIIKINYNNIDNFSTNDFIKSRKKSLKFRLKKTILNMNIYFMFDFTKKTQIQIQSHFIKSLRLLTYKNKTRQTMLFGMQLEMN